MGPRTNGNSKNGVNMEKKRKEQIQGERSGNEKKKKLHILDQA